MRPRARSMSASVSMAGLYAGFLLGQSLAQVVVPGVFIGQVQVDDEPPDAVARVTILDRPDAHRRAAPLPRRHLRVVERVLPEQLHLLVGAEPVEDARHRRRVGTRLRQDMGTVAIDRDRARLFLPPAK